MTKPPKNPVMAARMRRYRERKSGGRVVLQFEVDREFIVTAHERGLLRSEHDADKGKLAEALRCAVDDWCARSQGSVCVDPEPAFFRAAIHRGLIAPEHAADPVKRTEVVNRALDDWRVPSELFRYRITGERHAWWDNEIRRGFYYSKKMKAQNG